jgi:hypothetical protein
MKVVQSLFFIQAAPLVFILPLFSRWTRRRSREVAPDHLEAQLMLRGEMAASRQQTSRPVPHHGETPLNHRTPRQKQPGKKG